MIVPDLQTAERITWMTEMLLSHGRHALPVGLTAALREYKSALLAECAAEKWARPRHPTCYGRLADLLAQQITDGEWKPGQRDLAHRDCGRQRYFRLYRSWFDPGCWFP